MTLTIGNLTFHQSVYDEEGDVLYLHVGEPVAASDSEQTPEGHLVRLDSSGEVVGLTLINARRLLERDGILTVTLPEVLKVTREELDPALKAA